MVMSSQITPLQYCPGLSSLHLPESAKQIHLPIWDFDSRKGRDNMPFRPAEPEPAGISQLLRDDNIAVLPWEVHSPIQEIPDSDLSPSQDLIPLVGKPPQSFFTIYHVVQFSFYQSLFLFVY